MSDDLFAKWKADWKKGWDKIQTDMQTGMDKWNENTKKLFSPKAKTLEIEDTPNVKDVNKKILNIPSDPDLPITISSPENKAIIEEKSNNKLDDFQQNLADFRNSVTNTFSTWQTQWNAQIQKWNETNKKNNAKLKAKIEENNAKVQQFFEQTHNQMKQNLEKIEMDWKTKDKENRQQFYQGLRTMRENWNGFVLEQQKTYEKNAIQFNKKTIHTEIRILIWALPIIFIVLMVIFIFRPFFT